MDEIYPPEDGWTKKVFREKVINRPSHDPGCDPILVKIFCRDFENLFEPCLNRANRTANNMVRLKGTNFYFCFFYYSFLYCEREDWDGTKFIYFSFEEILETPNLSDEIKTKLIFHMDLLTL